MKLLLCKIRIVKYPSHFLLFVKRLLTWIGNWFLRSQATPPPPLVGASERNFCEFLINLFPSRKMLQRTYVMAETLVGDGKLFPNSG